ncbi:MAG TPA: hypothetical protein VM658_06995 [bacterium]|nr:hypothetical protein [bacterium]
MSATTSPRQALRLFLISFLSLYFEVIMIRWIPGQVPIIGYFTNLVLIASFLGLGVGCTTWRRGARHPLQFLWRLAVLAVVSWIIGLAGVSNIGVDWGVVFLDPTWGPVPSFVAAIFLFIWIAVTFIPLGRILGEALDPFPPLWGYSLNLLGSVLGVSFIALQHWFRVGPVWWIAVGLAGLAPLASSVPGRRLKAYSLAWALLSMIVVWSATGDEIWSPYYKIKVEKSLTLIKNRLSMPLGDAGYSLTINNSFFQFGFNLNPRYIEMLKETRPALRDFLKIQRALYQAPFDLFHPRSVLVLGAGSGNDVAVALQNHVPRIVAVEIDPVIAQMGKDRHPMRPYLAPEVELKVDDARQYLRTSPEKFDMIIYGLLDSHRLTSYMSTVRLESFVYTFEGLRQAAAHLNPGGVILLCHTSPRGSQQKARLFQTLDKIFPGRTHVLSMKGLPFTFQRYDVIIAGGERPPDAYKSLPDVTDVTAEYRAMNQVRPATDDWPFLYLQTDSFKKTGYLKALLIMVLASILIIRRAMPEVRRSVPLHFFLLGSGFLLLETKSVIELSLLFGSTWTVNSVAIGSFLVMALLANLAVHRLRFGRTWIFYLALFAVLALNAAYPVGRINVASTPLRVLLGGGFVALPVFFSGVIFAVSFRKTASPSAALGANVMGAVLGGFGEYASMFLGYHALYLVAALLYLGSWLFMGRGKR